jgi:hypothetical protein
MATSEVLRDLGIAITAAHSCDVNYSITFERPPIKKYIELVVSKLRNEEVLNRTNRVAQKRVILREKIAKANSIEIETESAYTTIDSDTEGDISPADIPTTVSTCDRSIVLESDNGDTSSKESLLATPASIESTYSTPISTSDACIQTEEATVLRVDRGTQTEEPVVMSHPLTLDIELDTSKPQQSPSQKSTQSHKKHPFSSWGSTSHQYRQCASAQWYAKKSSSTPVPKLTQLNIPSGMALIHEEIHWEVNFSEYIKM